MWLRASCLVVEESLPFMTLAITSPILDVWVKLRVSSVTGSKQMIILMLELLEDCKEN